MKPFTGNVVLVAGASRGIGAALAVHLAAEGARLVLAARDPTMLEAVASRCRDHGAPVLVCPTDLTDEAQCRRLLEQAVACFGQLDTLIYNAGRGEPGWFADQPDLARVRHEIDLNYLGMVACVHHALPHLLATRGRIVGVATLGALVGFPYLSGYNAAKHAMRGFLDSLRAELRPRGVSVTVIYPGAVATERLKETLGSHLHEVPTISPERCAALIAKATLQRRREVVLGLSGKLLRLCYRLFPALIDRQLYKLTRIYRSQGQ